MATKKSKSKKQDGEKPEQDGIYLLKIVLYFVLGCLWVRIGNNISLPVGLVIGGLLASHEHFQIDRKVEYAILLVAAILSYIAPIGFVLSIGA